MFNVRSEFLQLKTKVNDYPLVYLDSAATTLKPKCMVDRYSRYLNQEVSNVHRGAHFYSNLATEHYENTRNNVAEFINCDSESLIFTYGTTDSINLVATIFEHSLFEKKQSEVLVKNEIVLTSMEHHSNIVPWYELAKRMGFVIKTIPFDSSGRLDLSDISTLINEKTYLVSLVHMSNTFGVVNPIEEIIKKARAVNAYSLVDAAQSVSFLPLDVQKMDCDFLAFSSHKLFGPEGLGFLYIKNNLLNTLPIYRGGGSMVSNVDFDHIDYLPSPQKYEAGTPNIGAIIAFNESLDFFKKISYEEIHKHELELLNFTAESLAELKGFEPLGDIKYKKNILSFNLKGIHPSDIGTIIDQMGVAVRVGHHCTQPLHRLMHQNASLRASFSIYNNREDCERFVNAVKKAQEMLND